MEFLKKWASCIGSFITGVLGLLLTLCSGMNNSVKVSSESVPMANMTNSESTKAYEVLTNSSLAEQAEQYGASTEFTWLKAFAIVMVVVSILLIVYGIIMLLKNLNVIKSDNAIFKIAGIALAIVTVIAVIGLFVTSCIYASAVESTVNELLKSQFASIISAVTINVSVSVGIYQWLMLVIGIIIPITYSTFICLKRKNS